MIESIDTSLIDWSRAQFAMTAMYHWIFVPLTLGLAVVMGIMETLYYKTGNEFWKKTAQFWMKLFGINFAIGVATGLILEFEFGTNWSNYSWFVGDIFGAPLAIEGILAFFMEATFIAVMFFGWGKVSKRFHLASTWLTGLGATISAWWILVANAWMQHPVGMEFNPDTVRNEMVDFWAVATSPVAVNKFFHTVMSGWVLGRVFVVGISCWYLLKKRNIMDFDLLFQEFPEHILPYDYESYFSSPERYEMVTTNCVTGEANYFEEKQDKKRVIDIVRASSSLPFVCPIAYVDDVPRIDGGIVDSIPLMRAWNEGFTHNVVVLTRNRGYRKEAKDIHIPSFFYRKYPKMREALSCRCRVYNEQLEMVERMEEAGEITVIRPQKPVMVDRIERDIQKLTDLYEEGYACAAKYDFQ